ncbi:MAG: caspase family protein [Bacteroidetes bacterium]|nr:caspase family protein [Bacteroidota bacterium]HET6245913.1 caspase family protein [Bacteroidia bacterium]
MKNIFFLFLVLMFTTTSAQNMFEVNWEKRFGGGYEDQAKSIINSGDGAYVIAGWTKSLGNGGRDAMVVKVNATGNKIWEKTFGKEQDDVIYSAVLSPEGNYIMCGSTFNKQTEYYSWWVFAIDKNGTKLWENTYGGSEWDAAKAIISTTDGFVIAGVRKNRGDMDKEMTLMKINKKGVKQWECPLGVRYYDDEATSVAATVDEGFIVAGWSKKDSGPNKQIHLAKVDKRGHAEWQKTFGGEISDFAKSITPTNDGRFIITAASRSKTNGEEDIRVIKIDAKGELEWDLNYGGLYSDIPNAISSTDDNGCIIAGYTKSVGNGNENLFLMRLDRKGNIVWERFFVNYKWVSAESIAISDNGYTIAGWATSEDGDDSDLFIMNLTDNFDKQVNNYITENTKSGDTKTRDEIKKEAISKFKIDKVSFADYYSAPNKADITYRGGGDPLKGLNVTTKPKDNQFGEYYALIIGIDNYKGIWSPLKNAVRDAQTVEQVFKTVYKFDHVKTIYNEKATRANIIREMEWLIENVSPKDNVLIYYSGHGEFKKNLNKGFWVPVDASTNSTSAYISNSEIQTFLGGIPSRHTLLIADACFSGDIFRGNTMSVPFEQSEKYYAEVNALKSRQALTSGGIELVMDGGKDGHSIFAYYLLQALKENKNKYFDASQLYSKLKIPVVNNSEQTPSFNPIKSTGDEGGQFIFIKR